MVVETRRADHATSLYPQKLTVSSPATDGRTVGIVRLQTKGHGLSLDTAA
jgi:hypothetical protein